MAIFRLFSSALLVPANLLLVVVLLQSACAPVAVPLPPELAQSSEHFDVVSSSELLSLKNELSAGPFRLQVVRHEREDQQQKAGGMQRIRLMNYELTLVRDGKPAGTATCVERLSFTEAAGGGMASQDVEDSLSCQGKDSEGTPWILKTALEESGDASGFFQQEQVALKVRSLQRAALASEGQIRGYQLADDKGALVATQRVAPGVAGGLWLRAGSHPSDALMAAALALVLYVPMR